MEARIMTSKRVPFEEQLKLIMECRRSGLSDYQWCREHGINPATFYNWVSRHRQKACETIPPAERKNAAASPVQEVVRIDPAQLSAQSLEPPFQQEEPVASPMAGTASLHALEIEFPGAILRISNDVSPGLLAQTLRILRGMPC